MNETKKTIITLVIIFAIILLLPLSLYIKHTNGNKILNSLKENYQKTDNSLIYIGSSKCSFCDLFNPVIEDVSENYDFNYTHIDVLDLTNQQFYELLDVLDIDETDFGTPYLVIGKTGEKEAEKGGYLEKASLVHFLKSNNFLDENAEPKNKDDDELLSLNFIETDEYFDLLESKEKRILVIGQSGCGACIQVKPILNKIADENDVKINYLEIDMIEEEDYNAFDDSILELGIEELRTPYMMIIKDKKSLDNIIGSKTEDEYIKLFKKHEFIK